MARRAANPIPPAQELLREAVRVTLRRRPTHYGTPRSNR